MHIEQMHIAIEPIAMRVIIQLIVYTGYHTCNQRKNIQRKYTSAYSIY